MADDKSGYKSVDVGYDTLDPANRDAGASLSAFEIFKQEIVLLKWRVLVFACILTFGSYYIYDFPGSIGTGRTATIQAHFQNKGKTFNQEMNQALYSVYSWPNTVLAVFGGLLIDKFLGLRKAMTLFASLVAVGSVIFALGVTTAQYPLLIMGRIVFGLGGESLAVSQSAFVARWFKDGRGMALAFGIAISFSRVGSSFNFLFSPMIAAKVSIEFATWVGVMACGVSVISCLVLVMLDIYGTRQGVVPQESKETGEPFKIRQIVDMPALFWLASLMCVSVYCAVFPWIGIAKNYFQVKYDLPQDTASQYVSIYQFVCAGGSPVMGGMVDMVGRFSMWMIVAGSGFTLTHLLFLVTAPPPWFMMAFMGVVYSVLVSSLWPAVPYVVAPELVGLAYGIMTAMQNSGLATWPLISGAILDAYTPPLDTPLVCKEYDSACGTFGDTCPNIPEYIHNHLGLIVNGTEESALAGCCNKSHCDPNLPTKEGYEYTEIFFMATAAAGVLVSVILLIVDKRKLGVLGASPAVREAIKAEMVALHDVDETNREVN